MRGTGLLLARVWLLPALSAVRRSGAGERARMAVFGLSGLAFLGLLYGLLKPVAAFFSSQPEIGSLLVDKLLYLTFSFLALALLFSSMIGLNGRLFGAQDAPLFLVSAFPSRAYLRFRFWQACLSSGWMLLILWLPLLLALRHARGASWAWVAWGLLAPLPLLPMASALALLPVMAVARWFPTRLFQRGLLLLAALSAVSLVALLRWMQPERLSDPGKAVSAAQFLASWALPTPDWSPAAWVSRAVSYAPERLAEAWLWFGVACAAAALAVWGALKAVGNSFLEIWLSQQDRSGARARDRRPWVLGRVPGSPWSALLRRDLLALARQSGQGMQALFLSALVLVYVLNLQRLPLRDDEGLRALLFLPTCVFSQLIVIAVAARFVFPSQSVDLAGAWLLHSAPVPRRHFLAARYAFAALPLLALSAGLALAAWPVFKPTGMSAVAGLVTHLTAPLGLASLHAGLGIAWARGASQPEDVITGPSGVLVMGLSFAYVVAQVVLWVPPIREAYRLSLSSRFEAQWWALLGPGLLWLVLQIGVLVWPWRRALRRMQAEGL